MRIRESASTFLKRHELLSSGFLVLPIVALCVFAHLRSPYFPRPWDDGSYWVETLHLSFIKDFRQFLSAAFVAREERPVLLPLLGVPFYYLFGSIPKATMVVMTGFLAVFEVSAFCLLRQRGLAARSAALVATALSVSPVVLRSSQLYLLELPFLAFTSAALLFLDRARLSKGGQLPAGIFIAASLCLRPFEGIFFWALLGAFAAHNRELRPQHVRALLTAGIGTGLWYVFSIPKLSAWIHTALILNETARPWAPELDSAYGRAHTLLELIDRIFSLPGFVFLVVSSLLLLKTQSTARKGLAYAIAGTFLPLVFSLLIDNRATATQDRYFIAAATFWIGLTLSAFSRRRWGWIAPLIAVALFLTALPGLLREAAARNQENLSWKRNCLAVFSSLESALPREPRQLILLYPNGNLPECSCDLAAMERGFDWRFVSPRYVFKNSDPDGWSEYSSFVEVNEGPANTFPVSKEWLDKLIKSRQGESARTFSARIAGEAREVRAFVLQVRRPARPEVCAYLANRVREKFGEGGNAPLLWTENNFSCPHDLLRKELGIPVKFVKANLRTAIFYPWSRGLVLFNDEAGKDEAKSTPFLGYLEILHPAAPIVISRDQMNVTLFSNAGTERKGTAPIELDEL